MSRRWQFSLGSLFLLMTLAAAAAALFSQAGNWWILAALVVASAIWFCIIAGVGKIDEQPKRTKRSHQPKEITE